MKIHYATYYFVDQKGKEIAQEKNKEINALFDDLSEKLASLGVSHYIEDPLSELRYECYQSYESIAFCTLMYEYKPFFNENNIGLMTFAELEEMYKNNSGKWNIVELNHDTEVEEILSWEAFVSKLQAWVEKGNNLSNAEAYPDMYMEVNGLEFEKSILTYVKGE